MHKTDSMHGVQWTQLDFMAPGDESFIHLKSQLCLYCINNLETAHGQPGAASSPEMQCGASQCEYVPIAPACTHTFQAGWFTSSQSRLERLLLWPVRISSKQEM